MSDRQTMSASEPQTIEFRSDMEYGVTKLRNDLRLLLYEVLCFNFEAFARIGCNQFLYWDPSDPSAWVAPDGFVCFGAPDESFDSWKVWERGAPNVAVEIIDPVDISPEWGGQGEPNWEQKLESYRRVGVTELVRFEPAANERPLRVWDRVGGELVERKIAGASARSTSLPGFWLAVLDQQQDLTLRLSRDEQGADLFLTPVEALQQRRTS